MTKRKNYTIFTDIRKNPTSYTMMIPAAVYTLIFGYLTIPYIIIAFQQFNYRKGIFSSNWIWFKNFEFFFGSTHALRVTLNTLKLNIMFIVFVTFFAVLTAILFNEIKSRLFTKVTQSMLIMPYFLSWVVVSYIIFGIFSTEFGIVNRMLEMISMKPVKWLVQADAWTWILPGMRIWKDAGLMSVVYLAAISGIDVQLYDSAAIDGANRWHRIRYITIPSILPTISILVLLSIGKIMYGDFAMIYAIIGDNGLLYETTDVIDTYIFRALRQTGDPSQAMAVGLFQAVIGFILVYGSNKITSRFYNEGKIF